MVVLLFLALAFPIIVSSSEPAEGQIWNTPEEERIYNNHINSSNLLFPNATNYTQFAEELGVKFDHLKIVEYNEFETDSALWKNGLLLNKKNNKHYRFDYDNSRFVEIAIDPEGNMIEMQSSLSNKQI